MLNFPLLQDRIALSNKTVAIDYVLKQKKKRKENMNDKKCKLSQ